RVLLLTWDGRVEVPVPVPVPVPCRCGASAAGRLARQRGHAELLNGKRTDTVFLAVTVDASAPGPGEVPPADSLGGPGRVHAAGANARWRVPHPLHRPQARLQPSGAGALPPPQPLQLLQRPAPTGRGPRAPHGC